MSIYFHKILPLLFSPMILILILFIIGTFFKSKKINLLGILIIIICSLPIFSNKLINYLEINYKPLDITEVKQADAIVVLSGMVNVMQLNDDYKYEFGGSVDRFFAGIDLIKNNKASKLVFTRGKLPWTIGISEGEYLKKRAIEFGVSEKKIVLTENVQNTEQEAKSIKKLFPKKNTKLILVTSAFHMQRAVKIFKSENLNVTAYPVDFKRKDNKFTFIDLIPSASSLNSTSFFVREIIGRIYYKIKYLYFTLI